MATLRDPLFGTSTITQRNRDALAADGMTSLRRGWEAGRLGTEANSLAANELNLRAAGNLAEADALRDQIGGIQQRQGTFAPTVQRLEDINGLGDAGSWAAGQVGQGTASMVEPFAAAGGITALGTGLRLVPNQTSQAVGKALQTFAAPAAAYGINQRQLTGEFANEAYRDPELIARTSPTQLRDTANLYGAGAAVLDTLLPAAAGRAVGGAGFRAGVRQGSTFGGRTLRNMGTEGLTETGQNYASQQTQAYLNPNRDGSGDFMENVNAFAGGAIGSGPFAAAESMGDAGWRRAGAMADGTTDFVREKAGQVVDLAAPYAGPVMDAAKNAGAKVKGNVIDLADGFREAGIKNTLKQAGQDLKSKWSLDEEERALISGTPPPGLDEAGVSDWMLQNGPTRVQVVADRLAAQVDNDPRAADLYTRVTESTDPIEQSTAVEEAAQYIIDNTEVQQLAKQAGRYAETATKAGTAIGSAAGFLGMKAFDAAKTIGKGVVKGVQAARKQNAQSWEQGDVYAEITARKAAASKAAADETIKRAQLMGEYLSTTAKTQSPRLSVLAPKDRENVAEFVKDLGYQIATLGDLAERGAMRAQPNLRRSKPGQAAASGKDLSRWVVHANRIVNSLRTAYGSATPEVLQNLRRMASPSAAPVFDMLEQELQVQMGDRTGSHTAQVRRKAADDIVSQLDVDTERKLLAEGINIRAPEAKRKLLGMVEAIALGRVPPDARKELEKVIGKEPLGKMIQLLAPDVADEQFAEGGEFATDGNTVNDELEFADGEESAFDLEAAESAVAKGSGPKLYGFYGNVTPRSTGNPFAPTTKLTRDEYKQFQQDNIARKAAGEDPLPDPRRRPALIKEGQMIDERSGGGLAIDKKVRDLEKLLKVDRTPERMASIMEENGNEAGAQRVRGLMAKGEAGQAALQANMDAFFRVHAGGWRVQPKTAWEVMQDMGIKDGRDPRALAMFHDYLRQDGEGERSETVNQVLLDLMDETDGKAPEMFRTTAGTRRKVYAAAEKYFKENQLAVAEKMSNADPMRLDAPELLRFDEAARKVISSARMDGGHKRIANENILVFQLKPDSKLRNTQDGLLYVRGNDLIQFVQNARNQSQGNDFENTSQSFANSSKNQAKLDMIMDGMVAVMDTGRVQGWPYKINAQNQKEYFGAVSENSPNGIPASLVLATTTYGGMAFGQKQRKGDGKSITDPTSEGYQEKVAFDQNREFFTPDDSPPTITPVTRMQTNAGQFNKNLYDFGNPDPMAAETAAEQKALSKTPLDVARKPKGGRSETGAPDEFADQRARSIAQGFDPLAMRDPTERKLDAVGKAPERARAIVDALSTNFADGMEMIQRRMRTAQAPLFTKEKTATMGGTHYVAPLAHVLSPESIADMDLSPAEAKQLMALRPQVAKILLDGDFKQADRVTLARALFPGESAGKITAQTVKRALEKAAAQAASPKEGGAPVGKPVGARNAQASAPGQPSSQADRDAAMDYVKKVLGPDIKVRFEDITGYSGEWIEAENAIVIATTSAAGTLQTAYHEALHAFFSKFVAKDPRAMETLKALAENKPIMERVRGLLSEFPAAQAQLVDGEERLAYIYQFWAAGQLELPYGKPRTLFQKLRKFFRVLLGQVSDFERSVALFEAFHEGSFSGEPSAAGLVLAKTLDQGTMTPKLWRKADRFTQRLAALTMPAGSILAISPSKTARELAPKFWTNPGEEGHGTENEGYINARQRFATRYTNQFGTYIDNLSDADLKEVARVLQQESDNLSEIKYPPARAAAAKTRALLQRFRKYMTEERGLKIGDRGPFYFPRVFDTTVLLDKAQDFQNMLLTKYGDVMQQGVESSGGKLTREAVAERIHAALVQDTYVDGKRAPQRDDGVLAPFFASGNARELTWIDSADLEPFLSKDIIQTMTTYFHQGARAAEYSARFGEGGKGLDAMFKQIGVELREEADKRVKAGKMEAGMADAWVERQMRDVRDAVSAMEGTIGKGGNLTVRKFGSYMTVYQNVRLLPLALFASVVDPLGMVARGATMKQAYESFLRGMKEVINSWGDMFREVPKDRTPDKWENLAMAIGAVDAAAFAHHVADEYASSYMAPLAKKVNDKFFKANGMEAWNRGMRVGATKAAVQFLEHHKQFPGEHSKRWLAELGLSAKDVVLDADNQLVTDWRTMAKQTGMTEEQARFATDRVHYALTRWVQGAVLTPNAAQRPSWSSDPRYSMFFHLKQFSYSFHQTILKRAVNELNYGNMGPMAAFAWYIPVMIASDITKGLIVGGGELPAHLKGMDLADWMMHGAERAGVLGVGQIGVDVGQDVASLGGPAVEQIIDAFSADLGDTTLRALPVSPLLRPVLE